MSEGTQLRALLQDMINSTPKCRPGAGDADFYRAQYLFHQQGQQLEDEPELYEQPEGGIVFVNGKDGIPMGAAVIRRHEGTTAEIRMAYPAAGFRGMHYLSPLLMAAVQLATDLEYEVLTTGDLEEHPAGNGLDLFLHEYGFMPTIWIPGHPQRPANDAGSYMEKKLKRTSA